MNDTAITPTDAFEPRHLRRMLQFAVAFRQPEIVATLSRQLSGGQRRVALPQKAEQFERYQDFMTVVEYRNELLHEAEIRRIQHTALLKARQRMAVRGVLAVVGSENE